MASTKFWLYGAYGVSNVLKNTPYPFIQPILLKFGATVGKGCVIDTGIQIHRPDSKIPFKNLFLGDKVYLGHNILIDLTSKVEINNFSAFGANCQIWTHTGDWTFDKTDEKEKINPVKIGTSCIIYSGAIISQGVEIMDYSRVGAGAVVIRNVEAKSIVAGVPAVFIKKRSI